MKKPYAAFLIGSHPCGIVADAVDEIVPLREITPVPLAPESFLGLMRIRGRILGVFDFGMLLHLPPPRDPNSGLVLIPGIAQGQWGLRIDASLEILLIDENELEDIPPTLEEKIRQKLLGAYKMEEALMLLVNPEAVKVSGTTVGKGVEDACADH